MLIKFSPKRNAIFDQIKSNEDESVDGSIRSFCPTRWTVRGNSISSIIDNYTVLVQVWEECLDTKLIQTSKPGSLVSRHR